MPPYLVNTNKKLGDWSRFGAPLEAKADFDDGRRNLRHCLCCDIHCSLFWLVVGNGGEREYLRYLLYCRLCSQHFSQCLVFGCDTIEASGKFKMRYGLVSEFGKML